MQHHQCTHLLAMNSPNNDLVFSLVDLIGHWTDFVLGSWQGKVQFMSGSTDSDIWIHTYSLSGESPEKFRAAGHLVYTALDLPCLEFKFPDVWIWIWKRFSNKAWVHSLLSSPSMGRLYLLSTPEPQAKEKYITDFLTAGIRPSPSPAEAGSIFMDKREKSQVPALTTGVSRTLLWKTSTLPHLLNFQTATGGHYFL